MQGSEPGRQGGTATGMARARPAEGLRRRHSLNEPGTPPVAVRTVGMARTPRAIWVFVRRSAALILSREQGEG